jgi:hypothetical protein
MNRFVFIMEDYPNTLFVSYEDIDSNGHLTRSKPKPMYELRNELHNGRPAWDQIGSIHHSMCWTPFDVNAPEYGFWAIANLWTLDSDRQATGIVLNVPDDPLGDGPSNLGPTATKSKTPPLGWWSRGRPWDGTRTSGGKVMNLSLG